MEKQINKPKKSFLDDFKLWLEKDSYPKHYLSDTIGKKSKSSIVSKIAMTGLTKFGHFCQDVAAAIRAIYREIQ